MFLPFWLLPYTCALAFCEGLLTEPERPQRPPVGCGPALPPDAYAEMVVGKCEVIAFGTGRKV